MYICLPVQAIYLNMCVCEFMTKKGVLLGFPLQDSHKLAVCTDLVVVCSVTSGMFTAHSVCSSAAKFFFPFRSSDFHNKLSLLIPYSFGIHVLFF